MLDKLINDCHDFLYNKLLSQWLEHGLHPEHGYSYESLNHDWSVNPVGRIRLLTQCRQLYTFSHAYVETNDPKWRAPLNKLFNFIVAHYWQNDAWAFSLNDDLSLKDKHSDCYALAFVLLAFSYYFKATNDQQALAYIEKTHHFLQTKMSSTSGGFLESYPRTEDSIRRQNPHMHLLEGYLAAYQITHKAAYKIEINKLLDLLSAHFFDHTTDSLIEFFDQNWKPDTNLGTKIEPGHHFEWVWLLFQTEKIVPAEKNMIMAEALWAKACRYGFDPKGGIYNQIDAISGKVLDAEKRIWPITEYMKALCTFKASAASTQTELNKALDFIFSHYLKNDGAWHEYLDPENKPKPHPLPGTTSYHLFLSLVEVLNWAKTRC